MNKTPIPKLNKIIKKLENDNIEITIPNKNEGVGYAIVDNTKISFWWQIDYGIYYDTIEIDDN
jgi:hypothetical protein